MLALLAANGTEGAVELLIWLLVVIVIVFVIVAVVRRF